MVYNCGAILVDHGWLKLLGAGAEGLPAAEIRTLENPKTSDPVEGVLVGMDILGGCFVVHGSGLPDVPQGEVSYWAPDSLSWESTGLGYSAFVRFAVSDRLAEFYEELRWPNWQTDTRQLGANMGLAAYPPPWAVAGRASANVTRSAVPLTEVVEVGFEYARQLGDSSPGTRVQIRTSSE